MLPSGGLGGVRLATECPAPTQLCVIADGLAYVIDVEHPDRGASTPADTVTQMVPLTQPPLLLLARFSEIVALGSVGTAWESDPVFVNEIAIVHASETAIVCTGYNLGGSATVSLDPRTGDLVEGTTLRDLGWPE